MSRPRLRAIGSRTPEIADLARDVQLSLDAIPAFQTIAFTREYAEPMLIALDREPKALLLVRLVLDAAPEQVQTWTAAVHYVFTGAALVVSEITGATLATRYRFTFLAVG
jgi:hypothetical protein